MFTSLGEGFGKTKMTKTTSSGLQECWSASLAPSSSVEPFNTMRLSKREEILLDISKSAIHGRSGYNSSNRGSMSARHNVFVLDINGKPLSPTTNAKARKLMKGQQAKPKWNKFGVFGIQMLVTTRKEIPKTILGIDNGSSFEGNVLLAHKENILAIMLKLPTKKKLVKKIDERRALRRARRFRNCRRRKCRFSNRNKDGVIAPSQMQILNSRLKIINEVLKCYHIDIVAIEDIGFNHKKNKWGKNFSTMEIGKKYIDNFFIEKGMNIIKYKGYETEELRKKYGYKKDKSDKSKLHFNTHCSDALAIAVESGIQKYVEPANILIYVDDNYRYVRRRLHDTQYSKGGFRYKYTHGNFAGIRKGTIIGFDNKKGQLVGGTKENDPSKEQIWYQDFEMRNNRIIPQKGKMLKKIQWMTHGFKTKIISGLKSNSSTP